MALNRKMIAVDSRLHKCLKQEAAATSQELGRHVNISEWITLILQSQIKTEEENERLKAQGYDLTLDEKYERRLNADKVTYEAEIKAKYRDWETELETWENELEALKNEFLAVFDDDDIKAIEIRKLWLRFHKDRIEKEENKILLQGYLE